MSCKFTTTTHGKWILAGEHAVLRGSPALVYPDLTTSLCLKYYESSLTPCKFTLIGSSDTVSLKLFKIVLEQGLLYFGSSIDELTGEFKLECDIPVGVGLGSSAAISVATARWFASQNYIKVDAVSEFARKLENIFHGTSSGLDVAGVSSDQGIYFQNGTTRKIQQTWQPNWQLSTCSQISSTSECVKKVQELWVDNPDLAKNIDSQMHAAVKRAYTSLTVSSNAAQLVSAINQAAQCFVSWGLVNESMHEQMQELRRAGALAVKPTGSGGGGVLVSLWL